MTRADKLRSMTDEQLVDFIFEYGIDERLNYIWEIFQALDTVVGIQGLKVTEIMDR